MLGPLLASVVVVAATQEVFKFDAPGFRHSNAILSPEWHTFIEQLRQTDSLPGVSVGVVRFGEDKEPEVQLASWGRKTEEGNGHDLTTDVRLYFRFICFPFIPKLRYPRRCSGSRLVQRRSCQPPSVCSWTTTRMGGT